MKMTVTKYRHEHIVVAAFFTNISKWPVLDVALIFVEGVVDIGIGIGR